MFGNTLVQTRKTFVAMPPGSKTTVAAATTLLVLATAWLVYATGGVQFAFLHLMYVPVVLSALAFGVRGGVAGRYRRRAPARSAHATRYVHRRDAAASQLDLSPRRLSSHWRAGRRRGATPAPTATRAGMAARTPSGHGPAQPGRTDRRTRCDDAQRNRRAKSLSSRLCSWTTFLRSRTLSAPHSACMCSPRSSIARGASCRQSRSSRWSSPTGLSVWCGAKKHRSPACGHRDSGHRVVPRRRRADPRRGKHRRGAFSRSCGNSRGALAKSQHRHALGDLKQVGPVALQHRQRPHQPRQLDPARRFSDAIARGELRSGIKRRLPSPLATSREPRRFCAGNIRNAAWCRQAASSPRWRRRR